jgi:hypothetical protein
MDCCKSFHPNVAIIFYSGDQIGSPVGFFYIEASCHLVIAAFTSFPRLQDVINCPRL